jgi:hypothetical protein
MPATKSDVTHVPEVPKEPVPEAEKISVTLRSYALPRATQNKPYTSDLGTLVTVTGDEQFDMSNMHWTLVSGALPEGLVLEFGTRRLHGTPTMPTLGDSFVVRAHYRDASGAQRYLLPIKAEVQVFLDHATLTEPLPSKTH